jgi:small subunit ribosomal protein S14
MKHIRLLTDKSKRLFFKKDELKKSVFLLLNKKYSDCCFLSWKGIESKVTSRVGIKNYCILSGRARGVLRDFKLSRILLRKMGAKGFLSGLRKRAW